MQLVKSCFSNSQSLLKPSTILLTKQNQSKSDMLTSLTLQRFDSNSIFDADMDEGEYHQLHTALLFYFGISGTFVL